MSEFKNFIISLGPQVPKSLIKKFEIKTTYKLTDNEVSLFSLALIGIEKQLTLENINFNKLPRVTALITKDGEFSVANDENDIINETMGYRFNLIVYCVQKWRTKKFDEARILVVFLEELCHHYWNIEDEVEVKEKVTEVFNQIFPEKHYVISDLFAKEYLNNELIRQGKEPKY